MSPIFFEFNNLFTMDLDVLNVIYTILCYTMYSTKQVQENKMEVVP